MREQDDVFKKFRESFAEMRGHFHILEQPVPVTRQLEYFKYSEKIKQERPFLEPEDFEHIAVKLANPEVSLGQVKLLLTRLASSHEVKAYRMLEACINTVNPELKDWAQLAFMECRMGLESDLSDEKQIFISTGLGGKDERLRFFILMRPVDDKPFLEYQQRVIEREFEFYLPRRNCVMERLEVTAQYAVLLFFVPVRDDLKKIIDEVIRECNQYGNFLNEVFVVTNVKSLSHEEIMAIINENGDSKASD